MDGKHGPRSSRGRRRGGLADTVILATDGTEYARRAAERAIDLASEHGATLHVLCVADAAETNITLARRWIERALRMVGSEDSEA